VSSYRLLIVRMRRPLNKTWKINREINAVQDNVESSQRQVTSASEVTCNEIQHNTIFVYCEMTERSSTTMHMEEQNRQCTGSPMKWEIKVVRASPGGNSLDKYHRTDRGNGQKNKEKWIVRCASHWKD